MHIPEWATQAIFYEIFLDRFARSDRVPKSGAKFENWDTAPTPLGIKGGDLPGVSEHLDYLNDLGINALYLTPVFASASNHRYHTYDYYRVDPLLGGDAALKELLNNAHRRGMHVILDGVFNHAGRGLWQFHYTLENGAASPYVDWFFFDAERLEGRKHWGAYPSQEEEGQIQREGSLRAIGYQGWWDLPGLPKFNTGTPAVREFIFGIAEYWTKFGVDGWRLDVPGEIDDDSFWREFRTRVRALNPDSYIVGELWHDARRWLQGDQFDASMNYLLTTACLGFFSAGHLDLNESLKAGGFQGSLQPLNAQQFAERIDSYLSMYRPEVTRVQFNLLDSHDTPRFLTCAGGDLASLRLALTFLFTYPGTPCLFYGDEVGLQGRQDPECRQPFPWDESKWNRGLRDFVRGLIALRKSHPALLNGGFRRLHADNGVYAFERELAAESLIIMLNAAEDERSIELDASQAPTRERHVLFGQGQIQNAKGPLIVDLPPRGGCVIGLNP